VAGGIILDELKLVMGQAQLNARGTLLGAAQDASLSLTDFPAVLLQPLFSALPALQVRARAAAAPPACLPGAWGRGRRCARRAGL
jgi:hypothetical protein